MAQFFAHNRLFESRHHYACWYLHRYCTAEGQNPADVALSRLTDQELRRCWGMYFWRGWNRRITFDDLVAAVPVVRAAIATGDVSEIVPTELERVPYDAWPVRDNVVRLSEWRTTQTN